MSKALQLLFVRMASAMFPIPDGDVRDTDA
jgi:hypothetical protein